MKKYRLTANLGLKICSLIFAAVLWFIVTNINDPVVAVRFGNIPVTIRNTDLITDAGDVYQIIDNSDTIGTVTILAPRSVADSFSRDNVIATADVSDMTARNTMSIQLSVSKYSNEIESIKGSIDTVKLDVEKKKTKTLELHATTSGTVSDGYMIGNIQTEQNLIRISGPELSIDKIKTAAVDVDVSGFTSDIGTDADIKYYDADGNVVNSDAITSNIQNVRVNVEILKTKYCTLEYEVSGKPAEGYMLTGKIDSTPDEVLIAGKSSVLKQIESISIKDSQLNVQGLSSDLSATVDLSKYLPSGVAFGESEFNGIASVTVHIEPVEKKSLELKTGKISIENAADGVNVEVDGEEVQKSDTVSIQLSGLKDAIDALTENDITAVIDMNDIEGNSTGTIASGNYKADVSLNLPEGVTAEDLTVWITVDANEAADNSSAISGNSAD